MSMAPFGKRLHRGSGKLPGDGRAGCPREGRQAR